MKTVCFDFDGVIHSYKSGWKGVAEIPDPPIDLEVMKKELTLLKNHFNYKIAIYSTRCASLEGRNAIWEWLKKYDLNLLIDELCDVKPPATVYVDDRALLFDGCWSGMADKIYEFKNWTEKKTVFKKHTISYLCDGCDERCKSSIGCYLNGGECKHTSDIFHAKNFTTFNSSDDRTVVHIEY